MEGVATKTVEVPGSTKKLGIVIEKLEDAAGHVISSIKPDGPLNDLVEPGDCIVGIGSVDTRRLTGAKFTSLLLKQCSAASGTVLHLGTSHCSRKNTPEDNSSPDSVHKVVSASDADETKESAPAPSGPNVHKVVAPPGKLGLVLTKAELGHIIKSIKKGSALDGKVKEGDKIVGLDEKDTQQISVAALTSEMARTERRSRVFSIVRRDVEEGLQTVTEGIEVSEEEDEPEDRVRPSIEKNTEASTLSGSQISI